MLLKSIECSRGGGTDVGFIVYQRYADHGNDIIFVALTLNVRRVFPAT
jgi:transcriptional/translational regulatory protein YebC/TACO1